MIYYSKSNTDDSQQREKAHDVKSSRKQVQAAKSLHISPPTPVGVARDVLNSPNS